VPLLQAMARLRGHIFSGDGVASKPRPLGEGGYRYVAKFGGGWTVRREAQGIVGMPLKLGYCTISVNGVLVVVLPEVAVTVMV
jgi:hypothetical protein